MLPGGKSSYPRCSFALTVFPRDVTDHLQLLLRKAGHHLHTTAEREVVRTMKEKCCYIAISPSKEEKESLGRFEEFTLPDGNVVQVLFHHVYSIAILRKIKARS